MLVLTRTIGEKLIIDGDIEVKVVDIPLCQDSCRLN